MPVSKKHVVLGVCGSIAAYKAADIVRRLQDEGMTVSVIMTACAEKFITPLTLASLSGKKVFREMFDPEGTEWRIDHVNLADDADVLVIAPATANVISKIACGIADDLLTCTALATRAPVLIAPAMNDGMFTNKIFQENIDKLKKHRVIFIDPIVGGLACGRQGKGHLADAADIVKAVKEVL